MTNLQIMTFSKAPLTNSNSFNESNSYKDRYNGTSLSMSTTSDSLTRTTRRAPVKTFSLTRGVPRTGSTDSVLPDYHNNNLRSFYSDHDEKMKSPQSAPRKPKRFHATDNGRGDALLDQWRDGLVLNQLLARFDRFRLCHLSTA